MPKVSFILPAYKRLFLDEAIRSILAQTCRDFELVVVDDKSPERLFDSFAHFGVPNILPDYGQEWLVDGIRVRYYQNSQNLGGKDLIAAWNRAMEYAAGEFSVLASDDDVYHRDYLQEMVALVEKYPQVDVFHCREVVINADGSWRRVGEPRAEYETGIEMLYNRGVKRLQQTMPEFLFRTSALKAIGGFVWTQKAWFSDDATWMRLSRDSGAVCSAKPLFFWRASGVNITTLVTDSVEKLKAHEVFRKWVHRLIDEERPQNEMDRYLLDRARREIDGSIDGLTRWVLNVTPFPLWVKTLCVTQMPWRFRMSCIYTRLRASLCVWRWWA